MQRGSNLRANYRSQVNAMFRKQLLFQRRNVGQNFCLLAAPIFFCLLLLIIQAIINAQFAKPSYKCGCECLLCHDDPLDKNAVNGPESPSGNACRYTQYMKCLKTNTTNCGILYSTPQQSAFCAIPTPPAFPELLQVPRVDLRARPDRPNVPILTTVGNSGVTADALGWSQDFLPTLRQADYDRVLNVLLEVRNNLFASRGAFDTYVAVLDGAARVGVPLSSAVEPTGRAYIDNAWFAQNRDSTNLLYITVDDCAAFQAKVNVWKTDSRFNFLGFKLLGGGYNVTTALVNGVQYNETVVMTVASLEFGCIEGVPQAIANDDDMNRLLYCGFYGAHCNGTQETNQYSYAFHVDEASSAASGLNMRMWFNNTNKLGGGNGPASSLSRVGKAVNLVTNAFLRREFGANASVELQWFSEMPKTATKLTLDFSSLLGPGFFLWVLELLMPVMLQALVYEKERRLRIMMKMHGLDNTTYVSVTFAWWLIVYILYFFLLMIFGDIIGLKFFRENNAGIQILTYLLHGLMQIGWAFLLSCFFKSPKTAVVFGYVYVFVSGLICSLLLTQFYTKGYTWVWVLELIPGFSLYRGLWELAEYSFLGAYRGTRGMEPADLKNKKNGIPHTWAINILEFVVFMVLALYLEQVIDDSTGVRRRWDYPLEWFGRKRDTKREEEVRLQAAEHERKEAEKPGSRSVRNADVAQERDRALALGPQDSEQHPIVCHGLRKIYPSLDAGQPPKLAVKELSMAIERGECFGLLGPNGAGKTTSISMLVGFLEPTEGTAFVEGFDIRTEMGAVYSRMGVCPQHDILWDTLTAREHLLFYGRLKNLKPAELKAAVNEALLGVNLMGSADKRVGAFSGGMKRRLSVAISFIGKPAVVYLDEPSTGLDPASRRALWDVVRANKKDKAIILTTHSMQEAEVLCDRLGIFVNGELFCLGPPQELSARYGGYLVLTITTTEPFVQTVTDFVHKLAPTATISYSIGGTLKFKVPLAANVPLSVFFDALATQTLFPCVDYAVHNASLEDVFISIAQASGIKMRAID